MGKGDKWSEGVDYVKNRAKRVINAPKNAAENLKDNVVEGAKNKADIAKHKVQDSTAYQFAKAKGFKGKAKALMGGASKKLNSYEFVKKLKAIFQKVQAAVSFLVENYWILIATAVVILLYNGALFIIGIVQSASPTPHFYCIVDADSSMKQTALYQQYCGSGGFDLENLQGHYIIQDGSGPCTDCATNNLIMRFCALKDENYFDYLWQEDGMYTMDGQTVPYNNASQSGTLRQIISAGGNGGITDCKTSTKANGANEFATKHGKNGWDIANWGYYRDENFDVSSWEQTDNFYVDNSGNDKWVFDLSAQGSWDCRWPTSLKIGDTVVQIEWLTDTSVTGETVKKVLDGGYAMCEPEAGCVVYYDYGPSAHAVLITGYDDSEQLGGWRIIDSAKGLEGGYEGPLDDPNFAIMNSRVRQLLNSGQHTSGGLTFLRIGYIKDITKLF